MSHTPTQDHGVITKDPDILGGARERQFVRSNTPNRSSSANFHFVDCWRGNARSLDFARDDSLKRDGLVAFMLEDALHESAGHADV
jgi:hypothetical protein